MGDLGKKKIKISMRTREKLQGLFFVSPFIIGVLIFFAYPIFLSLKLSFGKIDNIVGLKISWAGIINYTRAFLIDVDFIPIFLQVISDTIIQFPLTIILSLIIAIMVNRDIKGRGFFRVVFFIPFLLGTGEVMKQLLNQGVDQQVLSIVDGRIIPYNILYYFGGNVVDAVQKVLGIIVTVLWGCGVQILLFLSGLQSISPALYEAAKIDGATEWEMFWKVTIPMISPMLLLNLIYSIVDSFTNIRNPMLEYIQSYGFTKAQFEYGAAMGWIYFVFIGLVVAAVFGLMKNYMHTNEVEEVKKRVKNKQPRVFTISRKNKRSY